VEAGRCLWNRDRVEQNSKATTKQDKCAGRTQEERRGGGAQKDGDKTRGGGRGSKDIKGLWASLREEKKGWDQQGKTSMEKKQKGTPPRTKDRD